MSKLSAAQTVEFRDMSESTTHNVRGSPEGGSSGFTTEPLRVPSFDASLYAITTRAAARLNASATKPHELRDLMQERKNLLDKKLDGTATPKEINRLAYVRWSLDRIEDAKYGEDIEQLEGAVASYERLLGDLEQLTSEISRRKMK